MSGVDARPAFWLFRDGQLGADEMHIASRRRHDISRHWIEVEPHEALRDRAQALVLRHPIRAAVALQIAAAITYPEGAAIAPEFVTFDQRLGAAAQQEGFRTRGV